MNERSSSPIPYLHLLLCPKCSARLQGCNARLQCVECAQDFLIENGIPQLFWPSGPPDSGKQDVTETVKAFYEENPFPNYDETDNVARLWEKAHRGVFARLLNEQIPFGARVLEAGCGTGQLSNFLGIAHRSVFGADICLNSLRLAQNFKQTNQLENVYFVQMNLFRPVFAPASFDVVISNGVLHSTTDTYEAFRTLAGLVKPSGHLIVGLYHQYGRIPTDIRRIIFRWTGHRLAFLDPYLREELGKEKRSAWFADQYLHPHETKHTIGEVLRWLDPCQLELVKTIPKTRLSSRFSAREKLFEFEPPGNALERGLIEAAMLLTGSQEGGFFTVISRKKP